MNEAKQRPEPAVERRTALSPMREPVFRTIWIASMVSNFGAMIQSVGAAWMMTSIARSSEMVALVQSSVTLPIMLFSLFGGAVADTFDRRRIMLGAQAFMLAASAALSAATFAGVVTPWLLLVFTFSIGCGAAFFGPAWQASVGEMVPRHDLPAAVALNSMGFNIARSLGPALGGAVVAAAGAAAAFAINAVSFVAPLYAIGSWQPPPRASALPRETIGVAIRAGLRYVTLSPAVLAVLGRSLVFGAGASAVSALMPLVARDLVGGGPLTYGILLGAFGVGAVGGALASARLRARLPVERLVMIACAAMAAAAAGTGWSRQLLLTVPILLVAGAAWVLTLSTFNVTVQLNAPRWVVARALSLYQMAAFGGMAAGSWTWGLLAEADGVPFALTVAAGVLLVCAALGLVVPLPRSDSVNLDPLRDWQPPETAVPIRARSGPVVVTVEFRIAEADVPAFLAAMVERRRVRRRDGARRWTLLRDLSDPELWVERFHLANWTEYIRHNNRITQADAETYSLPRSLHQGEGTPTIRRMIERHPAAPAAAEEQGLASEPLTDPRRFG